MINKIQYINYTLPLYPNVNIILNIYIYIYILYMPDVCVCVYVEINNYNNKNNPNIIMSICHYICVYLPMNSGSYYV